MHLGCARGLGACPTLGCGDASLGLVAEGPKAPADDAPPRSVVALLGLAGLGAALLSADLVRTGAVGRDLDWLLLLGSCSAIGALGEAPRGQRVFAAAFGAAVLLALLGLEARSPRALCLALPLLLLSSVACRLWDGDPLAPAGAPAPPSAPSSPPRTLSAPAAPRHWAEPPPL